MLGVAEGNVGEFDVTKLVSRLVKAREKNCLAWGEDLLHILENTAEGNALKAAILKDGRNTGADSVIVSCPATGRYKVLTYADFITQGYNIEQGTFEIEGLAYEKKLTE